MPLHEASRRRASRSQRSWTSLWDKEWDGRGLPKKERQGPEAYQDRMRWADP